MSIKKTTVTDHTKNIIDFLNVNDMENYERQLYIHNCWLKKFNKPINFKK